MPIGVINEHHLLIDGNEAVELEVSAIRDNINADVTQRRYASDEQRSIAGYSTQSAFRLTCDRLHDDTYDWIAQRTGQDVVWKDHQTRVSRVTIGNINRVKEAMKSKVMAWGVTLDLFLVRADVNNSLPTEADLEVIE